MAAFLYVGYVAIAMSTATAQAGSWKVRESRSEMTDLRGFTMTLEATGSIRGILGSVTPSLIIRCREGELEVYVNSERVLDSNRQDYTSVRLRYDAGKPVSEEWSISSDHTSAFAPNANEFVSGPILSSRVFKIELEPYDASPVVATFRPTGLRTFMPRLRRACPDSVTRTEVTPVGATKNLSNEPYIEFQVEKPVQQIPGTGTPHHPEALRASGVQGEVQAQFIVNENGRVEISSFKVLKATNDLFASAVRSALPQMRFYPAELNGRNVRQLVQHAFQLRLD